MYSEHRRRCTVCRRGLASRFSGGCPSVDRKASPTKAHFQPPPCRYPSTSIAAGHADHLPPAPHIKHRRHRSSLAVFPIKIIVVHPEAAFPTPQRSPPQLSFSASPALSTNTAPNPDPDYTIQIAAMEDYGTESESDYTSYWRDWVRLIFLARPVPCSLAPPPCIVSPMSN